MVKTTEFRELIWQEGRRLYRDMPWRDDIRPYYVLVSELMLQQTQVDRVIPKFNDFIARFQDTRQLAAAPLADVLSMWSGLGYNRRAKYLHDAARKIEQDFDGQFPNDYESLLSLPGVGPGTAGAVSVYAFNIPTVFIETNIRTVYFHHFFGDGEIVSDAELKVLVAKTMDQESPRDFYWALMDYGSWLKRQGFGRLKQSRQYKKQSPLKGSLRETRGQIIKQLTRGPQHEESLRKAIAHDERFDAAVQALLSEGLLSRIGDVLHLTK